MGFVFKRDEADFNWIIRPRAGLWANHGRDRQRCHVAGEGAGGFCLRKRPEHGASAARAHFHGRVQGGVGGAGLLRADLLREKTARSGQ